MFDRIPRTCGEQLRQERAAYRMTPSPQKLPRPTVKCSCTVRCLGQHHRMEVVCKRAKPDGI